jgi:hypothetical protein
MKRVRKKIIIGLALAGVVVAVRLTNRPDSIPAVIGGLSTAEVVELTAKLKGEIRRDLIHSISVGDLRSFPRELGRWWSSRIIAFEVDDRGDAVVSTCTRAANGAYGEDFTFCYVSNKWTFDQVGSWVKADGR